MSTFQKPVGAVMLGILGRVSEGFFIELLAYISRRMAGFSPLFHSLVFGALKTAGY
jgi:hypothetical protein